jgi:hypothetical protein
MNLRADSIGRHTDPVGGVYTHVEVARRGERLASLALPALAFDADDVLGEPEAGREG